MSRYDSQPPFPPQPPQVRPPYGGPPPYGQPAGYPGGQFVLPPQPVGTSGWAVTSLVLGILSFLVPVVGSAAAIITGAVGLKKTSSGQVGGRGLAIAGLCMGIASIVIGSLLMSILLPALSRARETANEVKCQSNLRVIGAAWSMHANDHLGRIPPAIDSATLATYVAGETPTCVLDGKPYQYVRPAETNVAKIRRPGELVIAYDDPEHHGGRMIALFADGHTEVLNQATTTRVLAKIKAGQPATVSADSTP